ncbi:hypothetical protein JDV02_009058 [Purpureocillium takamizusanense]|uniref:Uncharacterized protein n=1 Tax=Purpureocillium takamizusanense TaxID=2060973 RepID=A0A9Q8VDW0_9HYPO|nr:uncharacterized protein JDV02_009058 [Purpureocillium takamizusanense]UNI23225.1 hypothetical protein JDV02_009058 [Purpureocillium takamizusanense]
MMPKYRATRIRLDFAKFNDRQPHEFFELEFSLLYAAIHDLVRVAFGTGSLKYATSPWRDRLSNTFCRHVEAIARPDIHGTDWDSLLLHGEERTYLLQGVIGRTLDDLVFSRQLFGSSAEHQAQLQAEDAAYLHVEGFLRCANRVGRNLSYLRGAGSLEPPHFWTQVNETAHIIMRMMMPVHRIVCGRLRNPDESRSGLYQRLHDVVAHAAWLSVGLQLSTCITQIGWLRPGDTSVFGQVNVSDDIYGRARQEAWKLSATLGRGYDLPHVARVKISVVPQITRYEPMAGSEDRSAGLVSYAVTRAHVAYYQAWARDDKDRESLVSLSEHLGGPRPSGRSRDAKGRTKARRRGRPSTSTISKAVRLGSPLVAVWAAWHYSTALSDDHVRHHLMGFVNEVISSIA